MSRARSQRAESDEIRQLASRRVEAVWACVGVLCPDMTPQDKKALAEKVLTLCRGEENPTPPKPPRIQITPAQVESIIWPNMQCINPRCPMLLFSNQIADELNEFFMPED